MRGRREKPSTRSTFGSAARFGCKEDHLDGDVLLNPKDDLLSSTSVAKGTVMHQPTVKHRQICEAKRWLGAMASQGDCKEASDILASQTGLSAITAAWEALLAAEREAKHEIFDDVSTDAGSDLPELSVSSTSSWPGPGCYTPNWEALRPCLAKGAPSFKRYSAREITKEPQVTQVTQEAEEEIEMLPMECQKASVAFTCPGGKIQPLPRTRPRRPSTVELDALASASRPLGPEPPPVAEEAPTRPRLLETGRLEPVMKKDDPGPGDYELPSLPGGRTPVIPPPREVKEKVKKVPGPAEYDLRASEAYVYPRAAAADFGIAREELMEHQQGPDYITNYGPLHVSFAGVDAHSSAALIQEESQEALRAAQLLKHRAPCAGTGPNLGPGTYDDDDLVLRSRPDRLVLPWIPRREGLPEHLLGLYQHYNRFGRMRMDGRDLLGPDDDAWVRQLLPRAFIQPPHRTLKRSWSAEDIWRLYLPKQEELQGGNFARHLDFEEWQEKEKQWRWLQVRHFMRSRPSLRLSYSLPDLELLKERSVQVDFSKTLGRPQEEQPEEVEGDVLLLSPGLDSRYPRVPQPVDMARQLGRDTLEVDDFEELLLSPKRPIPRTSCYVDMAKDSGRPEDLEMDPHIWKEESDRVFCYKPTTLGDAEEMLHLSPASVQRRLLPRTPTYDWAQCMGRPGVDPRVPEPEEAPEILLTNMEDRFVAPKLPCAALAPPDLPEQGS